MVFSEFVFNEMIIYRKIFTVLLKAG
uniref:Uncharacterized protein n=1 Tax=Anguilla anguilla TaxID=7936 RepID=A0A0E9XZZ0_ANGAN